MEREALKLALVALAESQTDNDTMEFWDRKSKAITAIKAALAQPAQKPSYWLGYGLQAHTDKPFDDATPLYTTPPQREWVGLTDEEIDALWQEWKDAVCLDHKTWAKAIEAKLKEKNT
jgi:hypothetical protein